LLFLLLLLFLFLLFLVFLWLGGSSAVRVGVRDFLFYMELVGSLDGIVTAARDVCGGVAFVPCLADLVTAVGNDSYFTRLDFGGGSRRVRTIPVR